MGVDATGRGRRRDLQRWQLAADLLRAVRTVPDASRSALAAELRLTSGTMTELVGRLTESRLISEVPLEPVGRGRPSTRLVPHPQGPVVLAAEISTSAVRIASAGIDGVLHSRSTLRHPSYSPAPILAAVRDGLCQLRTELGDRARVVSIAVTGTLEGFELAQSAALDWHRRIDLSSLAADLPLICTNDATLAGLAEARRGAAKDARVAVHLLVLSGAGGGTCIAGEPLVGATGAGAEYGHLPFGDPRKRCDCGAYGCWETEIGAHRLRVNQDGASPAPADQVDVARDWLGGFADGSEPIGATAQARSLGRGIAGLINAIDPDVVTLGGLAPELRRVCPDAFEQALSAGLMGHRRDRRPRLLAGVLGEDAPLIGAVELGLDQALSPAALHDWAALPGTEDR